MASIAPARPGKISLRPDRFDQLLAAGSMLMVVAVVTAIFRGRAEWGELYPLLWGHILTVTLALTLTPLMLLRRRGDRLHRILGWVWTTSLMLTALLTFGLRGINSGSLSVIHILSAWTLIQVPLLVLAARRHDHAKHRSAVRGIVIGALLIAGFFTFPFGRLMGDWLLG